MHFYFGDTSKQRLHAVHPDLKAVMENAIQISKVDFGIAEGVRSAERQKKLYEQGLSELDGYIHKSKHQFQDDGYGHAVDVYIWDDKNRKGIFNYTKDNAWMWLEVGRAILRASRLLNVPVTWGLTFDIGEGYDIPHFELKN